MAKQTDAASDDRASDKHETIRAELEAARTAFHDLRGQFSAADWRRPSRNSAWTVGQMLYHMASAPGFTAGSIGMVRRGKGFNPPGFIANRINVLLTKRSARKLNLADVGEVYDENHQKLLDLLDTVRDGEWTKSAKFFGKMESIEDLFHGVTRHFHEHEADVRPQG